MNDFRALIQLIIDKAQARSEVDKSIKDLQKEAQSEAIEMGLKITKSDVKQAKKEINSVSSAVTKLATDSQRLSKTNTIKTWADNNSKAMKEFGGRIDGIITKMSTIDLPDTEFKKLNAEFEKIKISARDMNLLGKTWGDSFKEMGSKFASWITVSGGIMTAISGLRKMKDAVIEIDTAMTNLYKVTDETDAKYSSFLSKSSKSAQELGRSVSSLVEQSANWAKLGYSVDESADLAKISSIYANVGEVDDATAVSDIVTSMKAFNVQASDSITIIDKLNALGNQYAVSSADLGTGLSNAASALSLAGNSMDQTLAMITAMSEVTQDASESGNALKILSMRLRGYDEETESYTQDVAQLTGEIANLTKTAKTPGGISIFTDDTRETYKSTYQIMKDISEIWDELTDKDQAQLLEKLAGKQRGNSIAALLTNMTQAENALNSSIESSGSAYAEQEKWMQSIEAKAGQFEAAFQSLSNTVIDSELVKFFVDLGTTGTNSIDGIIKALGSLGTISAIGGGILGAKGLGQRNCCRYNRLRGSRSRYCYG